MDNNLEPSEPCCDVYISVDIETAGPVPSHYALLSIGACTLEEPPRTFYVELIPENLDVTPEAFAIHHLDPAVLAVRGMEPGLAMRNFAEWVKAVTPPGSRPIFVGLNVAFDWMFVADYFYRYLGTNPFGHSALDIKALFMGTRRVPWFETSYRHISGVYHCVDPLTHNALDDALNQANLFRSILRELELDPYKQSYPIRRQ
jgi:ribonuclease T